MPHTPAKADTITPTYRAEWGLGFRRELVHVERRRGNLFAFLIILRRISFLTRSSSDTAWGERGGGGGGVVGARKGGVLLQIFDVGM